MKRCDQVMKSICDLLAGHEGPCRKAAVARCFATRKDCPSYYFMCQLLKGHVGPHSDTVKWSNERLVLKPRKRS